MFKVFAEAAHRAVPVVRKSKVSGERDGVSVADGRRSSGTGYREYEAHAVRTTRTERRGFERERRTGISRRIEFEGALAADVERFEEAFAGKTRSASLAARRAACRRLWGRSCVDVGGGAVVEGDFEASFSAAIEFDSDIEAVSAPLFVLNRALSNKAFPEKYSARSLVVVPAAASAALTFDFCENCLVTARRAGFAVESRHDRHTVLRPLDRKALTGGDRIIIACCWC
tara:strand:+ start:910 stop:1596 length:687 start_codon:yes stop_codon:yes gene_type:complete